MATQFFDRNLTIHLGNRALQSTGPRAKETSPLNSTLLYLNILLAKTTSPT